MRATHEKFLNLFRRRFRFWRDAESSIVSVTQTSTVNAPHLLLGQRGEALAAAYLVRNDFRLVASNFKIPVGRNRRGAIINAEIDLIAYDGATLCFVEVKTRTSDAFAAPETAVGLRKQRQISRAARAYRRAFGLHDATYRYDVVSIVLPQNMETDAEPQHTLSTRPRIELLRNFWTDAKFRKHRWHDNIGSDE